MSEKELCEYANEQEPELNAKGRRLERYIEELEDFEKPVNPKCRKILARMLREHVLDLCEFYK